MTFAGVTPNEVRQGGIVGPVAVAVPTLVPGMSITPNPAGPGAIPRKFLVATSCVMWGDTVNQILAWAVYVGGVLSDLRGMSNGATDVNVLQTVGFVTEVTAAPGQAIEAYVWEVAGGGLLTIANRNILVHRVNP